jgi:sRNA-binding carbon storage regulator CsrA
MLVLSRKKFEDVEIHLPPGAKLTLPDGTELTNADGPLGTVRLCEVRHHGTEKVRLGFIFPQALKILRPEKHGAVPVGASS